MPSELLHVSRKGNSNGVPWPCHITQAEAIFTHSGSTRCDILLTRSCWRTALCRSALCSSVEHVWLKHLKHTAVYDCTSTKQRDNKPLSQWLIVSDWLNPYTTAKKYPTLNPSNLSQKTVCSAQGVKIRVRLGLVLIAIVMYNCSDPQTYL